jgi:hypothetical protein
VVLSAADPTNPALVAVKLTFTIAIGKRNLVVEEHTDRAPVGAEDSTVAAAVDTIASITDRVGLLCQVAAHTLDGLDGVSVHRMRLLDVLFPLIVELVVAKTAADVVAAAGGQEGGLSSVMGAALIGGCCGCCCYCFRHYSESKEGLYTKQYTIY